jgi:hypothetical protein
MTVITHLKPGGSRKRVARLTSIVRCGPVAALLLAALTVMPSAARASVTHTVCASGCDFTSVEAATMASSAGDGIEVMPGTYREQVFLDKPLSISGAPGEQRPVIQFDGMLDATVTIAATGAGATLRDLDIRGVGMNTTALQAFGAVTATDLDLAATGGCAQLAAATPSQLGPGVIATTTGGYPYTCVFAGRNAADVVTGVTIRAPDVDGVVLGGGGTLTDATVNGGTALILQGASTARRSTLNGTVMGVEVASGISPSAPLLSDSVVTSTADNGIAVFAPSVNMFQAAVRLRNVTAVASGPKSTGVEAQAQINPSSTVNSIDARNVIARGTDRDVFGQPPSSSNCGSCAAGQVIIGYSNFRSADGVIDSTIGHNQSADPLLLNAVPGAGQDFHIASASSPLIAAGAPDASDGPGDRDGVPHRDPPAIGAYEYPISPAGQPGTPTSGPSVSGPTAGTSLRPTISSLAETNTVFAVARTSTPLQGRTAAVSRKRGTVFSFRLDQPATTTIVITTGIRCARTKAGTHRNLRCSGTAARLTRSAHAGLNRLPFTGRIRGRPLRPGRYRAVFTATSAGGTSASKTLQFRIVAR